MISTDNSYLTLLFNEPIFYINETLPIIFEPKKEDSFNFFGENQQNILILIEKEVLTEEMLTFVTNILKSVNLDLDDVAIVENYENSSKKKLPQFEKIIQFGGSIIIRNLEITSPYNPLAKDSYTALLADKISLIMGDVQKKRLLWEAIKKMF